MAVRIAGLILLFVACLPLHLSAKLVRGPSPWPRRFLRSAAWIVGARVDLEGQPLTSKTLVVANHTSWLDILLLGGTGAAFVSKAEIERVKLIGWLADQNHTVYIERTARTDAHAQVRQIATALDQPKPLVVFPEGTTTSGRELLPFRPTLLDAVAPPPSGVIVRPVAIDFGDAVDQIAWHDGEPAMDNVRRVLGRRGVLPVTIRLLEPLPSTNDRKQLAREARSRIAAALSSVTTTRRV